MTEKESRPVKAASYRSDRGGKRTDWSGWRLRREVSRLPDEELIRVVRGMVAVDRAVNTYRKQDAKTVFIPPTQTRTP
jgi:hypothetical protein